LRTSLAFHQHKKVKPSIYIVLERKRAALEEQYTEQDSEAKRRKLDLTLSLNDR
jgi:hypothetical protein